MESWRRFEGVESGVLSGGSSCIVNVCSAIGRLLGGSLCFCRYSTVPRFEIQLLKFSMLSERYVSCLRLFIEEVPVGLNCALSIFFSGFG